MRACALHSLCAWTCSSSVVAPTSKNSKGDLEAQPSVTQKQRNWNPKSAVRPCVSLNCVPLACTGPYLVYYISILRVWTLPRILDLSTSSVSCSPSRTRPGDSPPWFSFHANRRCIRFTLKWLDQLLFDNWINLQSFHLLSMHRTRIMWWTRCVGGTGHMRNQYLSRGICLTSDFSVNRGVKVTIHIGTL